jgi:MFS family permease
MADRSSRARTGGAWSGLPTASLHLVAALFLVVAATNILTPLLPQVQDDFDVSIATVGLVVGSFGLARLVADLPAGWLADRFGHRPLSIVALVLLVASSIAGLASPTLEVLIVARIGSGLSVAILATVILAALAATAGVTDRARVMGLFPTANNASTAFYPMLGAILGAVLGWRATFGVTAILAIVGGIILVPLLLRIDIPRHGRPARPGPPDRKVLHGPARAIAIGSTSFGVVATMVHRHGFRNTVLPLYAATVLGLGGLSIATAIALMSMTALAVSVPGGAMSDRIGRRRVIATGLLALALGDLAYLLTNELWSFLLVSALIGFGDFFPSSQTAVLSEVVPAEQRTRVLSGYRFSVDLGAFIGPILLAVIMDASGAEASIVVVAALLAISALIAWIGIPPSVDRVTPADDDAAGADAADEAVAAQPT